MFLPFFFKTPQNLKLVYNIFISAVVNLSLNQCINEQKEQRDIILDQNGLYQSITYSYSHSIHILRF